VKIKEVRFEKLFSNEKYNNERIGFVAEVEQGQDPDQIAGQLFFKIVNIEDCLQVYRRVQQELDHAVVTFEMKKESIRDLKEQIHKTKINIEELATQVEKGEVDARLQHACAGQSYKQMQENLVQYVKNLQIWDNTIIKLSKAKTRITERIKNGIFSLEDIEIPRTYERDY